MLFYFPMLLTAICTIIQTYFCKKGYPLYALFLSIAFTCSIFLFFLDYHFVVYLVLGNFLFYLMTVASYLTRSTY